MPRALPHRLHPGRGLEGDLRRVRRSGAEHELGVRVDRRRGLEQVHEPLLARDPADEDDRRAVRVDPVALEHVGAAIGAVLVGVDPVVDHARPRRVDRRIAGEDLGEVRRRDGDDRVSRLERRPLGEARERVAAAELLLLPRAHRLEAVHRRDVRDPVDELREVAAEVRVPGVAVDELGARRPGGHREIDRERLERRGVRLRPGERLPGPVRDDGRAAGDGRAVLAPAVHRHLGTAGELAGEVLDVDAGAAVDVGRVLAREQRDLHASMLMPRRWRPS